jgi:hypothetical protein
MMILNIIQVAAAQTNYTLWITIAVCAIVAIMLFVKVIKFWLKLLLFLAVVLLIGKCYFGKKKNAQAGRFYYDVPVKAKV